MILHSLQPGQENLWENLLLLKNFLSPPRGSVIARIVGGNVTAQPDLFDPTVNIHVYEEQVNGRKLTEIINTDHENVKYLPGFKVNESAWSG